MSRAPFCGFGTRIPSVAAGTQPSATQGVSVKPAQNAYGSYAQIIAGASVTHDVYGFWLNIHAGSGSGTARDMLATLGIDPAGGTSYAALIEHILCTQSSPYFTAADQGGLWWFWPLFIHAGTSFALKASVNNASVGTVRAQVYLHTRPTRPDLLRLGTFVRTFGAVTATSKGTDVTPGTAADGSYVELGTLADRLWGWSYGLGANSATMENNILQCDVALGDATNKRIVIPDHETWTTTSERVISQRDARQWISEAVSGEKVYARLQHVGAGNYYSVCAYGIGG